MERLISHLLENGIYLSNNGDKLNVEYNGGSIPDNLLEEIKNNRDELLKYLARDTDHLNYKDIVPVENNTSFKLSSAQKRLWILSQFEDAFVAYNMPGSIDLNESIDIESFKRAIDSTIDRHEILRTIFKEDELGDIKQWILNREDLGFKIDYRDFRKEKNKEENVTAYISKDSYKPFDLKKGPLLRAALLQVEDDKYVFYVNLHHIIGDGWSMKIFEVDVIAFYEAYKENKLPALKPLKIQYKDYSFWELAQLEEESFKAHRDYWLDSLKGELPLLDLPAIKQRPKFTTYNGHSLTAYLSKETTQKLANYVQDQGGSLYMGLLACWNILMFRYTSQKDIIIGTPIVGREHADLGNQIGLYLNTLALRNQVDPEQSFRRFYKQVKESTVAAYTHQAYPFDRLVEELNVTHNIRNPIFNVLLDFHNEGRDIQRTDLDEREINSILDLGKFLVKHDLELHFTEVGENILIKVNFKEDVYDKQVIENVIRHYKSLILQLIDNSDTAIGQVNFLSEEEKYKLLKEFNETEVDYPRGKTIIDLFEDQVKNTPDGTAIKCGEKILTYTQLNELSNQLAHCIIENYGIKTNDLVGIKLDKGEWAVISMLGILKAGAAYVPIDPEYPPTRKQHILSDSKIKLLITSTNYLFDEEGFEGQVFAVDVEFEKDKYSKERINGIKTQESLAYVIYTSGSTGKPKGVMIEHGSLMNYLCWAKSMCSKENSGRLDFGLYTSLSFDLTVTSIYLPLISGGTLTIFDSTSDISSVLKTYVESNIEFIKITPAHINLLRELEIKSTAIRVAIVGGDKLENSHVEALKKLNPSVRIYNEYGPTESTVGCIVKEIISDQEDILIGKPIANTSIYIINGEEQLQAEWVVGEICIGGVGLARGYLNQDELTAEKFIKNPFKKEERLYRTGDLGRWLPDGNIEFIGRKDNQVKIRGYRIELGEIEHALLKNKQVNEAVVVVKENAKGEKELVSYITAKESQNASELRSYLKKLLPEYMVPLYYVQMETLPLTSNGKIDKKALPNPQGLELNSGVEFVAPRNEIEEKLVKIWEEILHRENIGIKDEFFTLGGDSIRAIQIVVQIKKTIKKEINVAELYKYQTIEELAGLLVSQKVYKQDEVWSLGMEMIDAFKQRILSGKGKDKLLGYEDFYPVAPIELGMIYSSLLKPEEPVYADQFIESLRIDDVEEFRSAISILVERHPVLRTKYFIKSFEEPLKIVYKQIEIPVFINDLSCFSKEKIESEIHSLTKGSLEKRLDFDDELLWSMHLNKIEGNQYLFLFCCHHALLDGWSISVLKTELTQLLATKNLAKLPALKSDYKDYTACVLGRQNSAATASYWKELLVGYNRNKLPFNYKRTRISSMKGMTTVVIDVPEQLLVKLEQTAKSQNTTIKAVFLAAHMYLLRILSSETDVISGVVTHDRPELEGSEKILGCFLNTVPLRVDFKKIDDFRSLLRFIQNYLIEVKPHEAHLTDIVQMIGEKGSTENPIFDTLLNFTDFHEYDGLEENSNVAHIDRLFDIKISVSNEMTNTYFDLEVDKTLERLSIRLKYLPGYFHEHEIKYALSLYV
ncbi:MAG: amino acid adenylation domain-containing protein, partial [Leadbetterella sp.]|nr:amino acid adenylation domain-containing protein [Leadbetterella sp.]